MPLADDGEDLYEKVEDGISHGYQRRQRVDTR